MNDKRPWLKPTTSQHAYLYTYVMRIGVYLIFFPIIFDLRPFLALVLVLKMKKTKVFEFLNIFAFVLIYFKSLRVSRPLNFLFCFFQLPPNESSSI